ncbi:SMP-30/gluconolactonase/LRE family protein [Streptomyces sp. NPDC020965]|uniref:SMP-30/gluconolactonase/LRE family protein n=1 Tax=Streptomyces sp. NPDC020965 TaxID=3365105 RepID=UPI0037A9BAA3
MPASSQHLPDRSLSRRTLLGASAALGAGLALPLAGTSQAAGGRTWPTSLALPKGFRPEGITIGPRPYAYTGSLANGDVHRVSLASGTGTIVSRGLGAGHPAVGLTIDTYDRRLFISGGPSGELRVVDLRSGEIERVHRVGGEGAFVNDVVLMSDSAWFSDSLKPQLYRLALGRDGTPGEVSTIPLTGDWVNGPSVIDLGIIANGIARTPDGTGLLLINLSVKGGGLMRIDPRTGVARRGDLGVATPLADGLLVIGRTLYCVLPHKNAVDVFRLDSSGLRARHVTRITDPRFQMPPTIAPWGDRLYLPNGRFDVPPTPDTEYNMVAIPRPRLGSGS